MGVPPGFIETLELVAMSSQTANDWPQGIYDGLHHPFRRELLRYMKELHGPMAPVDYVKARGVDGKAEDKAISYVSYHLRQLHAADLVDYVTTEPVRGANKHIYRIGGEFSGTYGDTLALNQIAFLLGQNLDEASPGVLEEISEIVTSTGRSLATKRSKPL